MAMTTLCQLRALVTHAQSQAYYTQTSSIHLVRGQRRHGTLERFRLIIVCPNSNCLCEYYNSNLFLKPRPSTTVKTTSNA